MDNNDPVRILFLASDPSDAARLRLGQELRDIRERLQLSKHRHKFALESRECVRPGDISQAIFDVEPRIVHFSGHGTTIGELCLEDIFGKIQPVQPSALAALFELVADQITCVVLNACYSEVQAKAIAKHIPFVVGMNQAIGDKAAIAFAVGFYKALGAERQFEAAYKFGCTEIQLQGISEYSTPILHKKSASEANSSTTKWVLVLSATIDEVNKPLAEAIVAHLRQLSGDTSITLQKIDSGSVRLILEGSQNGFEQINELFKVGHFTEVLGIPIQNVHNIRENTQITQVQQLSGSGYSSYVDFQRGTEILYTHLLSLRKLEHPDQLISRFRHLFIEGRDYPDLEISTTLNHIINSHWADSEFNLILHRCCYILMNYWWSYSAHEAGVSELVNLFQASPSIPTISSTTERLRELIKSFANSDQYLELKHRAALAEEATSIDKENKSQLVRDLIPRYPYLYPYCLANWDSSDLGHQVIGQLKDRKEKQFEQDLHQYMVNRLRLSNTPYPSSISPKVENPTLLSNQQLETSLRKFAGKAEGSKTYQELAKRCVQLSSQQDSYQTMKQQLYNYLVASISYSDSPTYGKHHFNQWLREQLNSTLPQNNALRPSSFFLVQTCARLIDCLVANPRQHPNNHAVFVDLITNLGATFTVGLLLKIILLCQDLKSNLIAVKSYLAKRLAIILKHYETRVRGDIEWFIESLENLNVAFTVNFGSIDFSHLKLL
ncbi:MAG: CHAT domain-containing protein [Lyngbya sp. HA4199-MV5]|jgi:hypothetical protein|nr:CHAT domain-containing protein [Lyngbya sp. HA4199-MV5]